jgi:hypothetical protein
MLPSRLVFLFYSAWHGEDGPRFLLNTARKKNPEVLLPGLGVSVVFETSLTYPWGAKLLHTETITPEEQLLYNDAFNSYCTVVNC